MRNVRAALLATTLGIVGCRGGGTEAPVNPDGGADVTTAETSADDTSAIDTGGTNDGADVAAADTRVTDAVTTDSGAPLSPTIAGCPILPSNHIFNTRIDALPVHASSAAFMTAVGNANIHLDLGQSENMAQPATYYGIPYNVVQGNTLTWQSVAYTSLDTDMDWNPRPESDCAVGVSHTLASPCTTTAAPVPLLPIPASPLVEGGIFPNVNGQAYGDHHILMLHSDTCRLWEIFHAYTRSGGGWDIFGSAMFDLRSNALRPADWTSADAAGFPILPLLLRADEASTGVIRHALRFTIGASNIRNTYVWPARHHTNTSGSTSLPQMGQLFRLKASYVIPANFGVQSRAILTALKEYGMYIADGGSTMYIQGEPSANWASSTISQVQMVPSSQFEAVDISPIMARPGFDPNSGAVPPP